MFDREKALTTLWTHFSGLGLDTEVIQEACQEKNNPQLHAARLALRGLIQAYALAQKPHLLDASGRLYCGLSVAQQLEMALSKPDSHDSLQALAKNWAQIAWGRWAAHVRGMVQDTLGPETAKYFPAAADPVIARAYRAYLFSMREWVMSYMPQKAWGHPRPEKIVLAEMWKHLDRKAYGIASRLVQNVTVGIYVKTRQHEDQLTEKVRETPNFMRLIGQLMLGYTPWAWRDQMILDGGPPALDRWDIRHATKDFQSAVVDRVLARDGLAYLRSVYLTKGGTAAGWAWLCKQSPKVVEALYWCPKVAGLCLQAGVKKFPAMLIPHIPSVPGVQADNEARPYMQSLRTCVAWAAAYQRKEVGKANVHEVILVLDYLRATEEAVGKKTWNGLWRRSNDWHREEVRARIEESKAKLEGKPPLLWSSLVASVKLKTAEAVSLTSSTALTEEGVLMSHCVGGYSHRCQSGNMRIFRILKDGEHTATLSIQSTSPCQWSVQQLYHAHDKPVHDPVLIALGKKVAREYTRAAKKVSEEGASQAQIPSESKIPTLPPRAQNIAYAEALPF